MLLFVLGLKADEIGFTASISATSNGENLWGDALDWVETGFHVVGGDSTDPDVTFLDFVDQDEGSSSTNFDRVALWRTVEGAIYWFGTNVIGRTFGGVTTTATEFTDSFRTLICPGGFVREGFNTLDFDVSNASSVMTLNNITVIGRGRSGIKLWFDAGDILAINQPGDVDETADTISYLSHGLKTGDQILYSREGNTNYVTGAAGNGESQLVTGTTGEYYYAIRVDDDTFAVASSLTNAVAGTRLALSGQTNEIHSFTRTPDTRFDFTQTGTSGTLTLNSCNLTSARNITLDTNATINTTNLIECGKLFLNGATLDGCSISSPTVPIGEGFIECTGPQLENIDDCSFTSATDSQRGPGHAIEVTSATGSASYTFTGNTFTDYASYSGTDHPVESIDTVNNRFTITNHPYTSGEAVYYDANGNTVITGLTDGDVYYVESIDANTIELWGSKDAVGGGAGEIGISGTISGSGHRFDSVNAAIWNNSGQSWTLSVTGGGTSPSVRNTGAVEVTIANNVSVTLTGLKTSGPNGEAATTEVRVYRDSDNVELAGTESSGTTFNFSVASGTAINIVIHNLYYIYQRISLTPTADIPELPIQQVVDRNYDPV